MATLGDNWMELVDNQWQYLIAVALAAIFVYFVPCAYCQQCWSDWPLMLFLQLGYMYCVIM